MLISQVLGVLLHPITADIVVTFVAVVAATVSAAGEADAAVVEVPIIALCIHYVTGVCISSRRQRNA